MARRCFECRKLISGSVVDHYRNNHYGTYLANGEDKILRFIDKFAPEGNSEEGRVIKVKSAKSAVSKTVNAVSFAQQNDPQYKSRVRMITSMIDSGCDVQTYRKGEMFICDVCQRTKSTGKRLMSLIKRYTVCYECFNTIKQANPKKRGNKHFFINTPM